MTLKKRGLTLALVFAFSNAAGLQAAHANMISTADVAAAQAAPADAGATALRARLATLLEREDVARGLAERGVSTEQARARVAALSDEEVAAVAQRLDSAPAGGDILGVIVGIFVLLLITDILGFTKVFPFTRSIR